MLFWFFIFTTIGLALLGVIAYSLAIRYAPRPITVTDMARAEAARGALDLDDTTEPGEPPPAAPPLSRQCVIIPHAGAKPDALTIDLHTAVLHVLQRPAHRGAVDLRDPMEVLTISRPGPDGAPEYATIVRWYMTGERPIEDLCRDEPEPAPAPLGALPRMDAGVTYVKATE